MDDIKIGLLNNYAALEAEPEKCPTCGSEDKNVRNWQCLPPGMRDFWHFLPSGHESEPETKDKRWEKESAEDAVEARARPAIPRLSGDRGRQALHDRKTGVFFVCVKHTLKVVLIQLEVELSNHHGEVITVRRALQAETRDMPRWLPTAGTRCISS